MTEEYPYSSLLIEIDALFDTRMAVLANLPDERLKPILETGYTKRIIDMWPGLDFDEFQEMYSKRDKSILRFAVVTKIREILLDFINQTLTNNIKSPHKFRPKIILNIHPYQLQPNEITPFIQGLASMTLGLCDIEYVNMSYEQLTPKYVKNNLSMIILYQYYEWLEIHSANENFKKVTCPEIGMLAPAMYFKKLTNIKDVKPENFEILEDYTRMYIGLKLLPSDFFSLPAEFKKEEDITT